jgi:thiol-disulfide isomerase/thioredoxin
MTCPSCAWEQTTELECERCGLILSKRRAPRPASRPAEPPLPPVPFADQDDSEADWKASAAWIVTGALVMTASIWLWRTAQVGEPPRRQPVEVRTPPPALSQEPAPSPSPLAVTESPVAPDAAPPSEATPVAEEVNATCPLLDARPPSHTIVSSRWHEGSRGFEDGEREQARTKSPMLVYFFTDWCQYCRAFEREVLYQREVESQLRVIKVRVNAEQNADDTALARRFGVSGYPSLFLVLPGSPPVSQSTSRRGRYDPQGFLSGLTQDVERHALAMVGEGQRLRGAGDLSRALEMFDGAIALSPELATAYAERGKTYLDRDDTRQALDDLRAAYALDPTRREVFGYAEALLERMDRHHEAAACRRLARH